MSAIKRLAGQTAIYGIPSILGRVLGYLLVPLYTSVFLPDDYGTVNVFYAFASLLKIVLTYGMETAFFRFSREESDKDSVYSTSLISLSVSTLVFIILVYLFRSPLANWADYPGKENYIVWFGWILSLDALASIPFARLRSLNKAIPFAAINLTGILVNIGLNLFFILLCPYILKSENDGALLWFIRLVYNEAWGIEYIFISNLVSSALTLALLLPRLIDIKWNIDTLLLRRMLAYAMPLLIAGMAGIINETFDRLLLRYLLPGGPGNASYQVGVYTACYKISILMTIFIQAYRYAAEPFFFAHSGQKDSAALYARIMDYFIITVSFIFLSTMLFLDNIIMPLFLKNKSYWEGRGVIPVLLLANLFLGVYYNLSIWYKLNGMTKWGAWLSIAGALITLVLNFLWIPLSSDHLIWGYYGSAWATLICYASMMVLSYLLGRKYYPVNYNLRKFFGYLGLALMLWLLAGVVNPDSDLVYILWRSSLLSLFALVVLLIEKPPLVLKFLNNLKSNG